jgi:hypothetical protein
VLQGLKRSTPVLIAKDDFMYVWNRTMYSTLLKRNYGYSELIIGVWYL